jgi:hypothetical protein
LLGGIAITESEFKAASSVFDEHGMGGLPLITDSAIAKAADTLTAPQLAALHRLQGQQLALIKIANESSANPKRSPRRPLIPLRQGRPWFSALPLRRP